MKTTYTLEDVSNFLSAVHIDVDFNTLAWMAEGHSSQVFCYQTAGGKTFVFRIRGSEKDLLADEYAYDHFSNLLPVPLFAQMGRFDDASYYCITEFIQGSRLNTLSNVEFQLYLPVVKRTVAKTFQMDISNTYGYGDIDPRTGNGQDATWGASLERELTKLDIDSLKQSAKNIGLPDDTVDRCVDQFRTNVPYVSETRRLLHGDPGGDNVLVYDGEVVALLDWEQMAYGDWVRDFSRFSFWEINDYGAILEFANEFELEAENIQERVAAYWAINALRNIEFADMQKSEKVAEWMRTNVQRIIL